MKALEMLVHEHEVILKVVQAAEREARQIAAGNPVERERIETILDFIRNFADRCHHAKEEDLLFQRLADRGFPVENSPIAVMNAEHETARGLVRDIAAILEQDEISDADAAAVAEKLKTYGALLRAHIEKENHCLYPMAEQFLATEDLDDLAEEFDRVEREEMGEGTHERYHQIAHELSD